MAQQQSHAVIAGTGRAGTSFLVRFLDECGLETDLESTTWFARARAGFEHQLDSDGPLPYVVKDPALFTYCTTLDLEQIQIDALIVPVRDLELAARSRVHQERLAYLENQHLRHREVQVVGATPGGVLYSLDVVDEARILAVGFHQLLHWALAGDLPLFLLEFPRLIEDRGYLLRKLWPWLGRHCTEAAAREAFAKAVDLDAVRIRSESPAAAAFALGARAPDPATLDRTALLELLERESTALARARDETAKHAEELEHTIQERSRLWTGAAQLRSQLQTERSRNAALEEELAALRADVESATAARLHAEHQLEEMRTSTSWRITAPLRSGARSRQHR
jgi:hypothetical protein